MWPTTPDLLLKAIRRVLLDDHFDLAVAVWDEGLILHPLDKMGIPFTPATPGGYHRTMESAVHPIPGTDYPRTFHEMDQWFRTDATCRDYVRRLRWPNGFVCAECGAAGEPWTRDRF